MISKSEALWKGFIEAGQSAPIYSVNTSMHLSLYVFKRARHTPMSTLTDIRSDRDANDVLLLDNYNQKLLLKVGGNR